VRLQRSSIKPTRRDALWLALGGAISIAGFLLGANLLAPHFLDGKLHEWVASIGTAGALGVMVYVMLREKNWRSADKMAQSSVVWGIMYNETIRLSVHYEALTWDLESEHEDGSPSYDLTGIPEAIEQTDRVIDFYLEHADRLMLLPPELATCFGSVLREYALWKIFVKSLSGMDEQTPGFVEVLPTARAHTKTILHHLNECIRIGQGL